MTRIQAFRKTVSLYVTQGLCQPTVNGHRPFWTFDGGAPSGASRDALMLACRRMLKPGSHTGVGLRQSSNVLLIRVGIRGVRPVDNQLVSSWSRVTATWASHTCTIRPCPTEGKELPATFLAESTCGKAKKTGSKPTVTISRSKVSLELLKSNLIFKHVVDNPYLEKNTSWVRCQTPLKLGCEWRTRRKSLEAGSCTERPRNQQDYQTGLWLRCVLDRSPYIPIQVESWKGVVGTKGIRDCG